MKMLEWLNWFKAKTQQNKVNPAPNENDAYQHADNVKIIDAVNRLVDEHHRTNNNQESGEKGKKLREWATIVLLAFTTAFTGCIYIVYQDQIGVMRDTEKRQLRAYLSIPDMVIICPDCGVKALKTTYLSSYRNTIRDKIVNTGQTPAYQVHIMMNLREVSGEVVSNNFARTPDDFVFSNFTLPSPVFYSHYVIGRDEYKYSLHPIESTDIQKFKDSINKKSTLFLYGHMDYCDIFNEPHSAAFCYIYIPPGEAVMCDRYNGEIAPRSTCREKEQKSEQKK